MAEAVRGSQTRYWILLIIGAIVTPLLVASIIVLYQFRGAHQERATTHLEELVPDLVRAHGHQTLHHPGRVVREDHLEHVALDERVQLFHQLGLVAVGSVVSPQLLPDLLGLNTCK